MPTKSSSGRVAEAARSRYETERVSERLRALRLGRKLTISRLAELSEGAGEHHQQDRERAIAPEPRSRH